MKFSIEKKVLPLNYPWKISRNISYTKTNLFISIEWDGYSGMGEIAPNIRYEETPEKIVEEFKHIEKTIFTSDLSSIDEFTVWLNKWTLSNSLRFGMESAFIHLLCQIQNIPMSGLLGIEPVLETDTCFSIPIMEITELEKFFVSQRLGRFKAIKLKINKEIGLSLIKELSNLTKLPLRIDANESFPDFESCMVFFEKLHPFNIQFIEQPMFSDKVDNYKKLKKYSPYTLIADESITDKADFSLLSEQFDGINMKLMKAGGYFNGIKILKEARRFKLKTMIGCMVETTLGISSAMNVASLADFIDLDGFLVIKEDPFGLVIERNGRIYRN